MWDTRHWRACSVMGRCRRCPNACAPRPMPHSSSVCAGTRWHPGSRVALRPRVLPPCGATALRGRCRTWSPSWYPGVPIPTLLRVPSAGGGPSPQTRRRIHNLDWSPACAWCVHATQQPPLWVRAICLWRSRRPLAFSPQERLRARSSVRRSPGFGQAPSMIAPYPRGKPSSRPSKGARTDAGDVHQ